MQYSIVLFEHCHALISDYYKIIVFVMRCLQNKIICN